MLCKKIIITDDNGDKSQKITDYIKELGEIYSVESNGGICTISIKPNDEKLYAVCCRLTEYIKDTEIKPSAKRVLEKEYSCFNADEQSIILNAVADKDEIRELTGRLYIYLKYSNSVNPFGFYNFLCRDIRSALPHFVSQEAEQIISRNDTEDLVELLKHFASMSMQNVERVDLAASKNGLLIVSVLNGLQDYNVEFADENMHGEDVISELVNLNPQKIMVHGKEYYCKNELSTVIDGVFGKRVELCTGCKLCTDIDN